MKNDGAWITGAAFSAVVALGYLICGVFVMLVPDATLAFLNEWTHGIDLTAIKRPSTAQIPLAGWISGFATISVTAFLAGTMFGWLKNVLRQIAHRTV